jgi:hypothetical protein
MHLKIKFIITFLIFVIIFCFNFSCNIFDDYPNFEDIAEKETIGEQEEEPEADKESAKEVVINQEIQKDEGQIINSKYLKIDISERCFSQNDEIKVTRHKNKLDENKDVIFGDYGYKIEFSRTDTFEDFMEITFYYDENYIPEGIPESSIFVAFSDNKGNLYYQGGQIDIDNNTITVNTIHASNWLIGWVKDKISIGEDVVIAAKDYPDYIDQRIELANRTFNLFQEDVPKEFTSIEKAQSELKQLELEFVYKWELYTAELERFEDNTRSYSEILLQGAQDLFGPIEASVTITAALATALGITALATTFSIAGIVLLAFTAVDYTIYAHNTEYEMTKITNMMLDLNNINERMKELRLVISILEDEKLEESYKDFFESEGIFITEEVNQNIYTARQSYQESKDDSYGGKPLINKIYWEENNRVLHIQGSNFGEIPTNNEKVRFTHNNKTRNILGAGREVELWNDNLITVNLNGSIPINDNTYIQVKSYGKWSDALGILMTKQIAAEPEEENDAVEEIKSEEKKYFNFDKFASQHVTAKEASKIAVEYLYGQLGFERPPFINNKGISGIITINKNDDIESSWTISLLDFAGRFTWYIHTIDIHGRDVVGYNVYECSEEINSYIENDQHPWIDFNEYWRNSDEALLDFREYFEKIEIRDYESFSVNFNFYTTSETFGYGWDWALEFWLDDHYQEGGTGHTGGNRDIEPHHIFISENMVYDGSPYIQIWGDELE